MFGEPTSSLTEDPKERANIEQHPQGIDVI